MADSIIYTSPRGPTGDPGAVYKGAWSSATAYVQRDVVTYGGCAWACLTDHTNQAPVEGTYWTLLVKGVAFQGAYSAGTGYVLNDLVTYQGSTWCALQSTTGNAPTEGAYWTCFAAKGTTGDTGAPGMVQHGAYSAEHAYVAGDVVSYQGSGWTALQNTTGNAPTEGAYWTLLVAKGDTGSQGTQGVPGCDFEGAYVAETTYAADDWVTYQGQTWCALKATTGNAPSEGEYWTLVAAKGATGSAGAKGDPGDPGHLTPTLITDTDSPYAVLEADHLIIADPTDASITIVLPEASTVTGKVMWIKTTSSAHSVIVDGHDAETIDGAANVTLATAFQAVQIISTGTGWGILAGWTPGA